MKRLFLVVSTVVVSYFVGCREIKGIPENMKNAFPDPNFRAYVLETFDSDGNGRISNEEAIAVAHIDVSNDIEAAEYNKIQTLKGIEYFTNLESLNCYNNRLASLDVSQNTKLTYLDCTFNQLKHLDLSNNTKLETLFCNANKLKRLDVGNNVHLKQLACGYNEQTNLDVSQNTELTYLSCSGNCLTSLNVGKNTKLEYLNCSWNELTSLDVSNTNLANSNEPYPLFVNIKTLQTLVLKAGWQIEGINVERSTKNIPGQTEIRYID